MKDTLSFIVKSIVDHPELVSVDEKEENGTTILTITVAKDDMGKVIGKEGKVIRSIRNIMKVKAMKQNKRITITIAENE